MKLHLLGTGAAVSDPHRTTTMLAAEEGERFILVDCGGDAFQRLLAFGLDPAKLEAIILTHEHPDHISGFPLLIEKLWLFGQREPIPVYGPAPTLSVARTIFAAFSTDKWEGLPDCEYHEIPFEPLTTFFDSSDLKITASPVDHPVPTVGLRFENANGDVLAYSCDTAKYQGVTDLAKDANVLVHEATGSIPGVHASAEEAAEAAREAGAKRLILVHLPPGMTEEDLAASKEIFLATEIGEEGGCYTVG